MSFQAYLDAIEDKTGLTRRALTAIAEQKSISDLSVKAGTILEWLAADCGLGRGHGMAPVQVIRNGITIDSKHVGSTEVRRNESDTLRLDGKASKPSAMLNE